MQTKKTILIIIILIILVAVAIGVWFFVIKKNNNIPQINTNPQDEEILNINPSELIVFEIKNENLPEFQREKAFERFNIAKNTITENGEDYLSTNNFYAWLEIASVQKLIGDYDRVAQLWKWFTFAYKGNSISPANLGDLYKSFIVNKEESEKYYLIALERDKKDFQIYYGLYELYRYRFEDSDKALQVLYDGFENNSDNPNFVNEVIDYLLFLDRKSEAEKVVEEYIKDHPDAFLLRERLK
ncbi:MAG: hypothetical protein ABIF17_04615 [Patescibacteria group bacterium]